MLSNDWRVRQQGLLHPIGVRKERMRERLEARYDRAAHIPGTSAYRNRECMDSIGNAVSSCYCGPKDTKSGKVARVLCGLSVASVATGICGMGTGVLPYEVGYSLGYAGMAGCGITPCVGHSGKCCNTEASSSNAQAATQLQPISTQPSASMHQTSTAPVAAQVHRK
ncbi:hypothetical protein [Candidatus Mesenet endosymbiont of Agriotes lineatus]|uniref:hypothetical protein n=1 Tax=Candidatus Mesenet endosymbiont of Agriotes lineatus TaxID=3077948 RepID=UPI0030CE4B9F